MRSSFVLYLTIIFGMISPTALAASANGERKGDAVVRSFQEWMKKKRIKRGAIAIGYKGELIAEGGIGRKSTDMAPVASLSKAITATCVLKALAQKGGKTSDRLDKWMSGVFSELKLPRESKIRDVTIGQLMTHSSGLRPDILARVLGDRASYAEERMDWQLSRQSPFKTRSKPGSTFFYNNVNYLLLGKLIRELSGRGHEEYCFDQILRPLGIKNAELYPKWRALSSYGGWQISARDYLKFAGSAFASNRTLGKSPFSLPRKAMGGGAYYGVGMVFRKFKGGINYWHFGSWDWRGRVKAGFGAFFVVWTSGYSVSVNYDAHVEDKDRIELDRLLFRAAH